MRRLLAVALLALGVAAGAALHAVLSPPAAAAQAHESAGSSNLPSLAERQKRLSEFKPDAGGKDLALPEVPNLSGLSQETVQRYQAVLRAYYDYRRVGYEHRLRVFEWQLISTKVIFVVVLILVFAGIYFAAIQFHHGLRQGAPKEGEESSQTTEFVFSLKEFKVRSPVLGVIVLTLSLAFFYLYLVYVYPIVNVF